MAEPVSGLNDGEISANVQQLALALLFATVFLSLFHEIIPLIRYLKYAALPVLILLYVGSLKDPRQPVIFIKPYTLPFLILLLAYLVFLPRTNFAGIKDMLFIGCSLVFFTLFAERKVNVRVLNLVLLGVFAVLALWRDSTQSFSLLQSAALAESTLSLVFGLFAVFALLNRRYFWFLINAVALILSLKRIALLGVLVVVLVMILPRSLRRKITSPIIAVGFNLLAVGVLLALGAGAFDGLFIDRFGVSLSQLVMGRNQIYSQVSEGFLANPIMVSLFGVGPGRAYDSINLAIYGNLHSDVLKIFYELGAVWFILFFFMLYAVSDLRMRVLALYLNIVFLTDNALIYVDVMVFYMVLAAQFSLERSWTGAQNRRAVESGHSDQATQLAQSG